MKVLVLCGGESAERVVSWASGDAVGNWLVEAGYDVRKYDPEQPGKVLRHDAAMAPHEIGTAAPQPPVLGGYDPRVVKGLLDVLEHERPDVVFPILHGGHGEDGTLQSLLEWVRMPYVGSGPTACALAMDKHQARVLFQAAGIPVAKGFPLRYDQLGGAAPVVAKIEAMGGFPVVVKPLHGGSTVGLTKVHEAGQLGAALEDVRAQNDDVLVEALFRGRELTCAVVGGEAYPMIEIRPRSGFYDYENKYTDDRTDYLCPAPVSPDATARMQRDAVKAYEVLGCRGFARVDFLLNDRDEYICLEVNALPGMTSHSLVPMATRAQGHTLAQLMQRLVQDALRTGVVTA